MATLTVRRPREFADWFRRYRILLNGEEIGQLAKGEELSHHIDEGRHVLQAKIDWCGSSPLELDAREGERVVVVRSGLSGWRILFAIAYVLVFTRDYLRLEPE